MSALLVLTQGCKPKSSSSKEDLFSPTQNGFGVVVKQIGIDSGPGAALYYKETNQSPVLVWPCIGTGGDPILYTNDIALLLADKPDEQGYMGNGALIAVEGVGPAMDISQDVLKIASEQNHVDFKRAQIVSKASQLKQITNAIKVIFVAWNYKDRKEPTIPDLEAQITWEQVIAIIRDVKSIGKTNRVVNTDVLYLQKDYASK